MGTLDHPEGRVTYAEDYGKLVEAAHFVQSSCPMSPRFAGIEGCTSKRALSDLIDAETFSGE
jgi:hypothetical protein